MSTWVVCQMCCSEAALYSATERSPTGRSYEAFYCPECYKAKYLEGPGPSLAFPRPRMTIRWWLALAGVWAVLNAVLAWFMRAGFVTGTPAQVRQWTILGFAGGNLAFALFLAWLASIAWILQVLWYRRTGGRFQLPRRNPTRSEFLLHLLGLWPFLMAAAVAGLVARYLTPQLGSLRGAWVPVFIVTYAVLPSVLSKRVREGYGYWIDRIRRDWLTASWLERGLKVGGIVWSVGWLGIIFAICENWIPVGNSLVRLCTLLAIGPVGQLSLFAALAVATRPR